MEKDILRKFVFVAVLTLSTITIGGCVTATTVNSIPSNEINLESAKELDLRREQYAKCLAVKAAEEIQKAKEYSKQTVKNICLPLEKRYYEAAYSAVFPRHKRSDYSANTARAAVRQIDRHVFDKIDKIVSK